MTKYSFVLILMLLFPVSLFAQSKIEDTTLNEVVINANKKKKIKKLRVKGFPPLHNYFIQNESIITGINNCPSGKIKSVIFNFNNNFTRFVGSKFNQINDEFLDMEFGLLLYEMNDDGTIGNVVSDSEIKFFVSKDHWSYQNTGSCRHQGFFHNLQIR